MIKEDSMILFDLFDEIADFDEAEQVDLM